ncbi:hypothetical protein ABW19_dt0208280 [Dactylella cylindrospora]|nr:hypothetical protein ABW19_dt0208280 [Dactylella cylindrospora]
MIMSTSGGGTTSKRVARAVPAFNGNNIIHSNPLPPVSNLLSFSYGSPQATMPKPITIKETRIATKDALERADAEAKARLEAAAHERKLAEERAAAEAAAAKQSQKTNRQPSAEPTGPAAGAKTPRRNAAHEESSAISTRRRGLRSRSVASKAGSVGDGSDAEDNFNEGDETSLEIHRIIASAKNPESSMLRSRSVNIGVREPPASESLKNPRSAMKGSREEANRPSAKTRAKRTPGKRTTAPAVIPVNGEKDATFDEENQGIGLASRLVSPSPSPQPELTTVYEERSSPVDLGPEGYEHPTFRDNRGTPPDTVDYAEPPISRRTQIGTNQHPLATTMSASPPLSARLWRPFAAAKNGIRASASALTKFATILGIFVSNLFGPLLNYLLLGFFIFGIMTLSYSFLHGSSSYTPPLLPPTSTQDVVQRLMDVERQLGTLFQAYDKGSKRWDALSQQEKNSKQSMEQQIASMKSMASAYSALSSALDQHTNKYKTDQRATIATISTMRARLEGLDESLKNSHTALKEYNVDAKAVRDQLTTVQNKINNVNADLQKLRQAQELGEGALRSLETMLPQQIAARLDPETGKITVAPELLRYLQSALRKDMEEVGKTSPVKGGHVGTGVTYNWEDFLKSNAAKMRGYVGQMSEEKWRDAIADGVVVSREDMIKVIRDELDSVRGIAERDNKELLKELISEAEGIAKSVVSNAATSISAAALAVASNYVRNHKGSSVSQYGDALIQAALHQYSAAILQKPDYALLARGTLIDPRLTSSTFDPYGDPGVFGVLSTFLRPGPNEPAHVLTESTNVGDCWSFPQSSGQVSMLLAEEIFPTHVTVDHVPRGISGDDRSAPREMEFWVRIEDLRGREQVGKAASVALGDVADGPSTRQYVANGYVRVASFIYDTKSQYPTQTFELPVELEKLGLPVRSVSFRVLSNWGNEEYTSIYRLRVHGNPAGGNSGTMPSSDHAQSL